MALKAIDPTKPILGYTLKQRIGAGGYGEVWAAEAPGGLPKAVKFIFGYHDEKRAQTELKSLNRIRSVRHPFLLSLERIEVVEGQLVVITELADMCLKTRFEQCVESGLNGIPRAELMGYLRDAAGALDFLSDEFRLQHLDVKPENLLLVSGHIKVADFGLVKDIHDGTQSLMSGLTPAYAPPELFDGRPSKTSDQYSLSILFQEMLTGIRPFDGSTAVQLASQHMKERPNLRPLPREDQATISRGLSKDPELRFPSCSALVDALMTERTQQSAPKPRTRPKLRDGKRKRRRSTESTLTLTEGTRAFAASRTETTKLPAIEFDAKDAKFRPTLILGVGNTGTQIVRQVRRRLNVRDGDAEKLPAIKLLCIDSDSRGLADACDPTAADGLSSDEIFQVPLRKPEEYRSDARMHLSWLSRRWIYNVPKSLQTEGIRPLGRLAMATHIEDLAVRLRRVLSDLVLPEHLATTADALELDPLKQPRVVIVGSISGGTCSGMAIDLAYVVRAILRQLSVADEDVLGFFTHSSSYREQRRELSIANTLAFLNELYHFSCVEEYPGDDSCGIPASTDGTTTFASTYLLHTGDDLDNEIHQQRLDDIAEYLYLGSATACGTLFDNCRRIEGESEGLPLRTMGLCRSGGAGTDVITSASRLLNQFVIRDWTTETAHAEFDVVEIAEQLIQQNSLTTESIVQLVHETINHVLKDPVTKVRETMMEHIVSDDHRQTIEGLSEAVDKIFGFDRPSGMSPTPLSKTIQALSQHFSNDRIPKLTDGILELVDRPGPRLAAASRVARELKLKFSAQCQQLQAFVESTSEQIENSYRKIILHEGPREEIPALVNDFSESLLQRFSLESVRKILKSIIPATTAVSDTVSDLKMQFSYATNHLGDEAFAEEIVIDNSSPASAFHSRTMQRLYERLPKLAARVEQQLQHNLLDQNGGFREVVGNTELRDQFQAEFAEAARATVVEQLREISLENIFDDQLSVSDFAEWITNGALPRTLECGGATRWVHVHPNRSTAVEALVEQVNKSTEQLAMLVPATVGEVVVCIEGERVPLDNVSMHLLQDRPDSIEFASRLHTRTDIAWTHISSMR